MGAFVISTLQLSDDPVEIVERKGLGHPHTICDALAENLSRALCREYRARFGAILHHNVDKALLCGGRAAPAFFSRAAPAAWAVRRYATDLLKGELAQALRPGPPHPRNKTRTEPSAPGRYNKHGFSRQDVFSGL
jgi:hypothetical protein